VAVVFPTDTFHRPRKVHRQPGMQAHNALAEFEALKIAFVSVTDSLDMTTPQGRLMFGIISAMTEFERSLIRERVKAGLKRAKARGHLPGKKRQILNLLGISERIKGGESLRAVAKTLNISPALLSKRLKEHKAKEEAFIAEQEAQ
jgi:DNA invertase Pin-like site-specific DNA recombinase